MNRSDESSSAAADPSRLLLSIIVPAYNERQTLPEVIRRIRAAQARCEIVVVDDGSTDDTASVLAELEQDEDVRVLRHAKNLGKGAAVRSGFAVARGNVLIIQDADLEYDPADYQQLLQPIVQGRADVVYGSRFLRGSRASYYAVHHWANRLLTKMSNLRTGLNLTDMETCYKAFRREVIEPIAPLLRENGFGIEPELTARLAKLPDVRIAEVPIAYDRRKYSQGKKITWKDGLRALWCILRY